MNIFFKKLFSTQTTNRAEDCTPGGEVFEIKFWQSDRIMTVGLWSTLCLFLCSHKGVKVELGIPYELWDKPSAEVTKMQRSVSRLRQGVQSCFI